MKIITFVCIAFVSISGFTKELSINPDRVINNLFLVFANKSISPKGVRVSGISLNKYDETYTARGNKFYVPEHTFDRAQKLAASVFRASSGDSSGKDDGGKDSIMLV